jgi:hypothetical protein
MDLHEIETHTTHSFFIGEFSFHVRESKIFKFSICLGEEKLGYRDVSMQFSYYHTQISILPHSVGPYLCTQQP